MQIPAIYWSYKTASHAAELTVGGGQCTAWDKGLLIGGENVITCFAREGCTNKPSRELSPLLLHFIANLLL
uniref:Uncharacterized protein n=1 Tax=Brassica oleracea var. oleracea TaxID=109376 RepID=A0A0D3E6K4_BRAOL